MELYCGKGLLVRWLLGEDGVKKRLRKVIGQAHLNFEELRTLLVEVKALLNAGPLTYI